MKFIIDYLWTPFIVLFFGYLFVKMTGKRAVSQMSSFDFIFIMIIGTSISEPIVTKNNWIASWYSFAVALCYMALTRLTLVNKLKHLLTNSPTVLIRGGDIDEKGLKTARMNIEELLGALRTKGFTSISDIELATMEESGEISVIPKSDKRPLQPSDLQMMPSPAFISIPLIVDGEIVNHNLKFIKKDFDWLHAQMQANNLNKNDLKQITLATYNQQGIVEFDIFHEGDIDEGPYNYKPGNEN
ncbi:DUF421 domain-containing protein [Bacillus mycoides]|uniref:DUF421 domain-containing protein n=1 Tax=Bacillus mycoides TaxID=1405 RepID=UPI003D65232F